MRSSRFAGCAASAVAWADFFAVSCLAAGVGFGGGFAWRAASCAALPSSSSFVEAMEHIPSSAYRFA